MAFYPNFPAIYAYPMPFPNQEFYMYPPGAGNGAVGDGPMYFEGGAPPHHGAGGAGGHHGGHHPMSGKSHPPVTKHGYANRKDSADSGISDFSLSSRKTSNTSNVSVGALEETSLEDVAEEPPFEEPEDELCEKIVQQVEFYFSDANITKDKFLLKHVKRNKEGFVSLKLISSFKRVKHLTKDWRQVAYAIERKSQKLEVNDAKTKVRRLDQLPEYDETTPSRTVVALNLPLERPTIEAVAEIFSACGDIVLIRILRPGNPVPADIKPFVNKHPEMTAKVCALVEYEKTEFAHKAVKELDEEEEEKMTVMELTAPPPKSTKKEAERKKTLKLMQQQQQQQLINSGPQRRFSHAGLNMTSPFVAQPNPDNMVLGPRRRISLYHNMKFSPISEEQAKKQEASAAAAAAAGNNNSNGGLNPNAPTFQMQQRRQVGRTPFIHPAAAAMEAAAAAAAHAAATNMQMMHGPSPWMMRRMSSMHGHDMAASGLALPPNVLRMPRGPDKGKGFQKWCRNRMDANVNAAASVTPAPLPKKVSKAVPIVAPPADTDVEKKTVEVEKAKPATEKPAAEVAAAAAASPAQAPAEPAKPAEVKPSVDAAAPAAAPAAPAAASAAPVAVAAAAVENAAAIAVAAADSCSDSGNEDGSSDETDVDLTAAGVNERIR